MLIAAIVGVACFLLLPLVAWLGELRRRRRDRGRRPEPPPPVWRPDPARVRRIQRQLEAVQRLERP